MKKIILFISLFLMTVVSYSQIDYPRYEIDSLGNKVIVMTIQQAQKLDNNTDLLELFKNLNVQFGSYDTACIRVINDKNNVIAIQKLEVGKLKDLCNIKDQKIVSLQNQITDYLKIIDISNKQINNKDEIIKDKDDIIKRQKTRMILGGTIGGAAIIGLLYIVLFL